MKAYRIYKIILGAMAGAALFLSACSPKAQETAKAGTEPGADLLTAGEAQDKAPAASGETGSPAAVTIAAAASLEACLEKELIPLFESQNPGYSIVGTYDSSGKLKTQIEEGADVDLFFSAAEKQMNDLTGQGLVEEDTVVKLLENQIVLIVPAGEEDGYDSFLDIGKAETIAVGDPDIVPAGQYAKEALTSLGLWEEVLLKASLGTNVTEVLNWVAEGSADAGIVYATDAALSTRVAIVGQAPEDSVSRAIYPAGIVAACENQDGARRFLEFLQSGEAMEIFVKNGFLPIQSQ